MKISELWLREWVNPSLTVEQLASQLTMAGLEVDAVSSVASQFSGVIVAEVVDTHSHPQADKLTLCDVKAADGQMLKVVCGAANVRPGLKVALATVGAQLGALKIKEAKLRGELSQGMLCSESELGMVEKSEGIMELDEDAPVGMDLRQYLQLDDAIIDVDLTPNRADCFSVLGIAREVAALNQLALNQKDQPTTTPVIDDLLDVKLAEPQACPNYCGRILRDINTDAVTPLWMREKLRRCGIRPLHPVVDVTNYVMLELGQPMHAFDLNAINGGIHVRLAKQNEDIELLDGQELKLDQDVLVIADDQKALAVAGIMGGEMSAVQEQSKDIFLESAFFNPIAIAGVARRYGLCTDSSQRYERGVDPQLQLRALERSTELLLSIVGGKAGPVVAATHQDMMPKAASFSFHVKKVKQLTGIDLTSDQIKSILESLDLTVKAKNAEVFEVVIPSHRFDLAIEEDLVEEVLRIYGYDNLKAQPAEVPMVAGTTSSTETMAARLAHWFSNRGYHETISYSFVDPELQDALYPERQTMNLLNPISSELSQMRVGLWSGLIASMVHNAHRQQHAMKLFENGVVFHPDGKELVEKAMVAGLIMGEKGDLNWSERTRSYDFFDLKGDLQALFDHLNLSHIDFIATEHPALHPGQSAAIRIGGHEAGIIGVLHPKISDALDINQDVILFELDYDALLKAKAIRYKGISKFPQIRRDLSFLVSEHVTASDIEKVVCDSVQEDWLKAFDVFDVYTGQGIPEGKKSLAISLTLQDSSRTLIDTEINALISAIINTLENKFAITLRD